MRSELFERVMRTAEIPHPAMKRLRAKNYDYVILPPESDSSLPDVHGIPEDCLAYGRCGVYRNGQLFMDGGPNGSRTGHPSNLEWGGYWGAKEQRNKQNQSIGVIYVRGRAGVSEKQIQRAEVPICDWISRNIPKA